MKERSIWGREQLLEQFPVGACVTAGTEGYAVVELGSNAGDVSSKRREEEGAEDTLRSCRCSMEGRSESDSQNEGKHNGSDGIDYRL